MPLHSGHLNLITYGLEKCKEITILLVVSDNDPIDPQLRYSWLFEHYKKNKKISIDVTYRNAINNLPQEQRTFAWCQFISEEYPNLDCIISSETYGDTLAKFLNISHFKFDHKRKITPISATEIRENYKEHMHYLPDHVRGFFSKL